MSRHELVCLYIRALTAEIEQARHFQTTGQWHMDCACNGCRALQEWQALSWWQRLRAKLAY